MNKRYRYGNPNNKVQVLMVCKVQKKRMQQSNSSSRKSKSVKKSFFVYTTFSKRVCDRNIFLFQLFLFTTTCTMLLFVKYLIILVLACVDAFPLSKDENRLWYSDKYEAVPRPKVPKPLDHRSYFQRDVEGNMLPLSDDSELWLIELEKESAESSEIVQRLSELFFSYGAQKITSWKSAGLLKIWMSESDLKDLLEELPLSNLHQIRKYSYDEFEHDLSAFHDNLGSFFDGRVPSDSDSNGNFPTPRRVRDRQVSRFTNDWYETKWELDHRFDSKVDRFKKRIMRRSRSMVFDSVKAEALRTLDLDGISSSSIGRRFSTCSRKYFNEI